MCENQICTERLQMLISNLQDLQQNLSLVNPSLLGGGKSARDPIKTFIQTVACLCARISRNDSVTVHELLLAQRQQVASGEELGTFEGSRGRKRPPHSQHLWSCRIEERILWAGGVIVTRPVDLDFHGKSQCSAGWHPQQTNKFNVK